MGGGGGGGSGKGGGEANFQQAHDVVLTSMRGNDVASTSFQHHVSPRFLINQRKIIIFLTVKSDNIFVVVVALLFYVHGKHLRSCWDGQLT